MVTRWGMSDALGMVQLAPRENTYLGGGALGGPLPYGEQTAQRIDAEVQRIVDECHRQAKALLAENRAQLDALVGALLERETLDQREILEVTGLSHSP